MTHSKVRAASRLSLFLLITSGLLPFYLLSYPFGRGARRAMSWPFYRACIALTGRPGLLSAAKAASDLSVRVQPVTITYGPAGKTGNAFTQQDRDRYAWYGDMELASHLWGVFGLKQGAIVSVHFHAPRTSDEFKDARALAAWAEKTVSERIRRQLGAATEMPEKTSIPTYDAGALKTSAP